MTATADMYRGVCYEPALCDKRALFNPCKQARGRYYYDPCFMNEETEAGRLGNFSEATQLTRGAAGTGIPGRLTPGPPCSIIRR